MFRNVLDTPRVLRVEGIVWRDQITAKGPVLCAQPVRGTVCCRFDQTGDPEGMLAEAVMAASGQMAQRGVNVRTLKWWTDEYEEER